YCRHVDASTLLELGVCETWTEGLHTHPSATKLLIQGFCETVDEGFRSPVGGVVGTRYEGCHRGNIDDRPTVAGDHAGKRSACETHQGHDVQEDFGSLAVRIESGEGTNCTKAGIVDQQLQSMVLGDAVFHRA